MSFTWFVPRSDLSPDQMRAVELPFREHALILGAPGSGKTLVLLHRARRLIEEQKVDPKRLHIFVYTNTLKEYIRSTLARLKIPDTCVTTFDHWCHEFYKTFISTHIPFKKHGPDFDAIRTGVLQRLRGGNALAILPAGRTATARQPALFEEDNRPPEATQAEFPEFFATTIGCPLYDAVLVDEGQDLTDGAFEILRRIAAHVTVCMDSRQQLYEERCDEPAILDALKLRKHNLTILGAFRCCPYIAKLAAPLLTDPGERHKFLSQTQTTQTERLTPLLYIAANAAEEKNRLAQIIKDRLATGGGDRIAVLFPNNARLFSQAKVLTEAGLEVEVPRQRHATEFLTHDFTSERPKLLTYYGAKGLTFDTVIMPRLQPNCFAAVKPERLAKLFFVGITRATKWVYLSTVEGPMLPAIMDLMQREKDGILTIQRSDGHLPLLGGTGRTEPVNPQKPTDTLTDIL